MKRWMFFIFSVAFLFSCNEPTANNETASTSEMKEDDVADIIRNPVSAIDEVDPDFVPKMTFEESTYDFGEVKEGTKVEHTFSFKNTGEVPLLIADARSTCGCTIPSYPDEYVKPGEEGKIKVVFDSKNLTGFQTKEITLVSNTIPRDTKIYIKGVVNGGKKKGHEGHNH